MIECFLQMMLAARLRVVLSPDPTAPTVVTAIYYRIGFRIDVFSRQKHIGELDHD